jgi:hypothetical protein
MNPNQLEVVIRSGKEYVLTYPEDDKIVTQLITNVVKNSDVRKQLMLEKKLDLRIILDSC